MAEFRETAPLSSLLITYTHTQNAPVVYEEDIPKKKINQETLTIIEFFSDFCEHRIKT